MRIANGLAPQQPISGVMGHHIKQDQDPSMPNVGTVSLARKRCRSCLLLPHHGLLVKSKRRSK